MLERTSINKVYRDTKSGALINKNKNELRAYKHRKQKLREQTLAKQQQEDNLKRAMEDVKELKHKMDKLTDLVEQLLTKGLN